VTVIAGQATFPLRLDGVRVAIDLSPGATTATINVEAPLEFQATFPVEKLALRLKETVNLFEGRLRLGPGAKPIWLGVEGDTVQLSLHEMLGLDVSRRLAISCRSIGLSDGTPYRSPDRIESPKEPAAARTVALGPGSVPLFVKAEAVDPLEIRYPGAVQVRERRPGWVMVEVDWADGSRLRGWTLERNTQAQAAPPAGWGEGGEGESSCGRVDEPPLSRLTIRRHAPIAAAPGGAVWARVAKTLVVEAFSPQRPDGWIRIGVIPGLLAKPCAEHEHLWVHARDVVRPKEKQRTPNQRARGLAGPPS
jgi:hypothetical protein